MASEEYGPSMDQKWKAAQGVQKMLGTEYGDPFWRTEAYFGPNYANEGTQAYQDQIHYVNALGSGQMSGMAASEDLEIRKRKLLKELESQLAGQLGLGDDFSDDEDYVDFHGLKLNEIQTYRDMLDEGMSDVGVRRYDNMNRYIKAPLDKMQSDTFSDANTPSYSQFAQYLPQMADFLAKSRGEIPWEYSDQ